MSRRPLLAALLLVACSGPPERATPPDIALAPVGTIGPFPPPALTTVIEVDAEGVIRLDGEVVALDDLPGRLPPIAAPTRNPEPCCPSEQAVVLRLDRSLPFGVAQWLIGACTRPDVGIYRIRFAVLPEGGGDEEGTLDLDQPVDHGLSLLRPWAVRGRARVALSGTGSDPSGLYGRVKENLDSMVLLRWDWVPEAVELTVDRLVPTGYALRSVDAVYRDGRVGVLLAPGSPPTGSRAVEDLVREARTARPSPTVFTELHLEERNPLSGDVVAMPGWKRVEGVWAETGPARPVGPPLSTLAPARRRLAEALLDAQRWLRNHQDPDGLWNADGFESRCKLNRCGGPGRPDADPAVTGLALLALLGAGNSHRDGVSRDAVKSGLRSLLRIQDDDGCFGPRDSGHVLENHALATWTMVLDESRTGEPRLRDPVRRAVDFLLRHREPGGPGDVWTLMALATARASGRIDVPAAVLEEARARLERAARECLSEPPPGAVSGPIDPVRWLLGSAALCRRGGKADRARVAAMTETILARQRRDGDERGSWDPVGPRSGELGRIGTTALMTLGLEMTLRHGRIWE